MNTEELITQLETDINEVYKAGEEANNLAFWDSYTDKGKRSYCRYMFGEAMWTDAIFNPPYPICPVDCRFMFQNSDITSVTAKQVDFSKANGYRDVFTNSALITLEFKIKYGIAFNLTFAGCTALKNLTIIGEIATSGFDVSPCEELSSDSIKSIFSALSTTKSGLSITLSKTSVNNAFEIDVDDETTYPEGSEYYELRHSRDNWGINYM